MNVVIPVSIPSTADSELNLINAKQKLGAAHKRTCTLQNRSCFASTEVSTINPVLATKRNNVQRLVLLRQLLAHGAHHPRIDP